MGPFFLKMGIFFRKQGFFKGRFFWKMCNVFWKWEIVLKIWHFFIFFYFIIQNFSGCFDTSGSLVALFVPKIWPTRIFVTEEE